MNNKDLRLLSEAYSKILKESYWETEKGDDGYDYKDGNSSLYIRLKEQPDGSYEKSEDGLKLKADYEYSNKYDPNDRGEHISTDIDITNVTEYGENDDVGQTIKVEYRSPLYKALKYYIDEEIHWGGHNEEGQW
jgi:hypothetical protein